LENGKKNDFFLSPGGLAVKRKRKGRYLSRGGGRGGASLLRQSEGSGEKKKGLLLQRALKYLVSPKRKGKKTIHRHLLLSEGGGEKAGNLKFRRGKES